ncbi:phage holin family protein [Candidatus Fermentibacteria bacterium]|nr:MAG: phage holin family protein [Candidatus Fermentibacteria bacterium]
MCRKGVEMARRKADFLPSFIVAALVLYLTSLILGSRMVFAGFWGIVITAGVVGLLNIFVAPLIALLTCPLQILTLGLARFLVSGLMIVLASHFLDSFSIASYWWAVLAAVIISILTSAVESLFGIRRGRN